MRSLINLGMLTALNRSHELRCMSAAPSTTAAPPRRSRRRCCRRRSTAACPRRWRPSASPRPRSAELEGDVAVEPDGGADRSRMSDGPPSVSSGSARWARRCGRRCSTPAHPWLVYDTRAEAVAPLVERGAARRSLGRARSPTARRPCWSACPRPRSCARSPAARAGSSAAGMRTFVDLSTTGAAGARSSPRARRRAASPTSTPRSAAASPGAGAELGGHGRRATRRSSSACRPLLETFGATIFRVGAAAGPGPAREAAEQPALGDRASRSPPRRLTVGVRAGLDPATLLEVFNAGSGRNTATSDKFPQQVLTRASTPASASS